MTAPQRRHPMTPVEAEMRLREIDDALDGVVDAVKTARDIEVGKYDEVKRARRKAILSAQCPKVSRNGITTAERDAWVEDQVADLQFAYELATAAREYAVDQMFKVKDQAGIVGKISSLVQQAYAMAGR
jgi:hypothetical protein